MRNSFKLLIVVIPLFLFVAIQIFVHTFSAEGRGELDACGDFESEQYDACECGWLDACGGLISNAPDSHQANKIFSELNNAYVNNDLPKVQEIVEELKSGVGFSVDSYIWETQGEQRLMNSYIALIAVRVKDKWKYTGAKDKWGCDVYITQDEDGYVEEVNVRDCTIDDINQSASFRLSIERAVYEASPLPMAPDPSVFDTEIMFYFRVD